MVARDPLISLASLRFFKLANVTSDQFLAGFRQRVYGAQFSFGTYEARPPKVVQLIRTAGFYSGVVHHAFSPNRVLLRLDHPKFRYGESVPRTSKLLGNAQSLLVLRGMFLPHTLLAASIGRHLAEIVGSDERRFFLSRHAKIVDAVVHGAAPNIELILTDKWMKLSRFLQLL
jgi:hypothetical protein